MNIMFDTKIMYFSFFFFVRKYDFNLSLCRPNSRGQGIEPCEVCDPQYDAA